jgi:hypothetical protein
MGEQMGAHHMRKILLANVAAGALVLGGHAALGADVDVFWNGPYLGLQGGWGWTSTKGLNASGDFGGGQLRASWATTIK